MTDIRKILNIADDGKITGNQVVIDANTFAAIDPNKVIAQMLLIAFSDRAVTITEASANPLDAASKDVIINGRSGFVLGTSLPVTLTLSLDKDGYIQALFAFKMIGDKATNKSWKFSTSFSTLPTVFNYEMLGETQVSPLDTLLLTNASFLVTSYATTFNKINIEPGISFCSDVQPSKVFSVFQILLSQLGPFTLSGPINLPTTTSPDEKPLLPNQYPWQLDKTPLGINLEIPLNIDPIKLGSAMTITLDRFHIYSPTSVAWMGRNPTYVPVIAFSGEIDIPSANAKVEMTVLSPIGSDEVEVIADFGSSKLLSLDKLADITGASNLLKSMPQQIQDISSGLGQLQIMQAGVIVGLVNKVPAVLQSTIVIGMPQLNWKIWDPYFEVKSISSRFTVQSPFKNPELDITVTGKVDIAGVPFTISAAKTENYTASVSLSEKVNLPLKKLMQDYVDGIAPPSDLTIDAMTLTVSPGQFYSFLLMMAQQPNPWVIDIGIAKLQFSDIELFVLKPASGSLSGTFAATASLAGLTLSARYDIPGDIMIRAELPSIKLSQIIPAFINDVVKLPKGFDLDFTQSYILMQKVGSDYKLELGTVIEQFGSLAFVVEKADSGWGVAAAIQITTAQISKLQGVGSFVQTFESWFPFDSFVLAISSLKDTSFTFPSFKQFNNSALGTSKITLPASVQGIDKGFFLYTNTTFTRKNKILGALIDLLGIPEGTQLQAMLAFLAAKEEIQLGVSLTTFLTPLKDVSQRTCQGDLAYKNTCLTGTLFVDIGGSDGFTFGVSATVKTILQSTNVAFTIELGVMANGIFVSGTMDNQQPLEFGPLKLGGVALELGISYEGIPSFGFAAEIDVAGAFNSSIAVLMDANNPANSMIAGAVSNINLKDVVQKMLGKLSEDIPSELLDVLATVGIKGTKHGSFSVSGTQATDFSKALDNFDGNVISQVFTSTGKQSSFPSSSEALMLFVDTPGKQWYITQKGSTMLTHWQLSKAANGNIDVSKEAQFYFVPNPAGSSIGKFHYAQGMQISGEIDFLFIELDVDIEMRVSTGIKIDAELEKIVLGTEKLFSITAAKGSGGPQVSIATFTQPSEPKEFQKPHFFINGKIETLGISRSAFININSSGAQFELKGDLIPAIITGDLSGSFDSSGSLDVKGDVFAGIQDIDLGPLGKFKIETGVKAAAAIWANAKDFGASVAGGFELAGKNYNLPKLTLDINTQDFTKLPELFFDEVKKFLKDLFTDPKEWAKIASRALGWGTSEISGVLSDVFGLPKDEIDTILKTVLCPVGTALGSL